MIKVLDAIFHRLGVIKNVISSTRLEEINGENALDFQAVLDDKAIALIGDDTIFELDNDWFDTAFYKKTANEDGTYVVEVESQHVSYRLNDPLYNLEYFTETGSPAYILGKILEGTPFAVDIVAFTDVVTYSAQEAKSRRQLLMEFTAYLGGELDFNKFDISILQKRGSSTPKQAIQDRHVKVVSKTVNKREKDAEGNPLVSYSCEPLYLPTDDYVLGDSIRLVQPKLGISEALRVVRMSVNPYDPMEKTFEFANYTNGLASSLYRIETTTVQKDKLYNGTRIGPEYGFENIRGDKKARSYFRADEMKFQTGDGTGENWRDCLYYATDPETGAAILVFDGVLSVDMITALSEELVLDANEIVAMVRSSAEYKADMAQKASILDITPDKIKLAVGPIGGNNLIRNSTGYFGTKFWGNAYFGNPGDSFVSWDQTTSFNNLGINTPTFLLTTNGPNETVIYTDFIDVQQGFTYTFACEYLAQLNNEVEFGYYGNVSEYHGELFVARGRGSCRFTFTVPVGDTQIMIRVDNNGGPQTAGIFFWATMLLQGSDVRSAWSPCASELKNSSVTIDDSSVDINTETFNVNIRGPGSEETMLTVDKNGVVARDVNANNGNFDLLDANKFTLNGSPMFLLPNPNGQYYEFFVSPSGSPDKTGLGTSWADATNDISKVWAALPRIWLFGASVRIWFAAGYGYTQNGGHIMVPGFVGDGLLLFWCDSGMATFNGRVIMSGCNVRVIFYQLNFTEYTYGVDFDTNLNVVFDTCVFTGASLQGARIFAGLTKFNNCQFYTPNYCMWTYNARVFISNCTGTSLYAWVGEECSAIAISGTVPQGTQLTRYGTPPATGTAVPTAGPGSPTPPAPPPVLTTKQFNAVWTRSWRKDGNNVVKWRTTGTEIYEGAYGGDDYNYGCMVFGVDANNAVQGVGASQIPSGKTIVSARIKFKRYGGAGSSAAMALKVSALTNASIGIGSTPGSGATSPVPAIDTSIANQYNLGALGYEGEAWFDLPVAIAQKVYDGKALCLYNGTTTPYGKFYGMENSTYRPVIEITYQ